MHKFLRAVGFREYTDKKRIRQLIRDVVLHADQRSYIAQEDGTVWAEFDRNFADGIGIAVCGEFDGEDNFSYDYYYPYLSPGMVSTGEDVSVERHAFRESYAGVCEDPKVGVSLIFYLQNMIAYLKYKNTDRLPVRGTTVSLSALSCEGTILMPLQKTEWQKKKIQKDTVIRNRLIQAARYGDEEAIESLTLEDMDTYTAISRQIQKTDVFSLVDTYFMPYGVECDQYSILGEITRYRETVNAATGETLCMMSLCCNDLEFQVCINRADLVGEPAVGRRFRGTIWLQGWINYPNE